MLLLFPSSTTTIAAPIAGSVVVLHADAVFQLSSVAPRGVAVKQAVIDVSMGGVVSVVPKPFNWAAEASAWTWIAQITAGNKILPVRHMTRLLIHEQESVTLRARPTTEEGAVVYAASIETAMVSVFDTSRDTKSTAVYQEELVVSDVCFSALQLDKGWRQDRTGYSFKYQLPAGVLIEGGRVYRVELVLRTYSGGPRILVWEVETSPVWTARAALGV